MLLSEFGRSQNTDPNPDPILPHIKSVVAECNNKVLIVVLSENVRCFSLSNDGSEFSVSPLIGFTVVSTSANSCVFSTELDTVWITISDPLPGGSYTLTVHKGTDNNTLIDDNARDMPDGESFVFGITPPVPTVLDSVSPVVCAPDFIQLVFPDPVSCNTIAADGSDFVITGSTPVSVLKATAECNNGFTQNVTLTLGSQLLKAGHYQVTLRQGSDGNSIVNECGTETPPGGSVSFDTRDAPSASFTYDIEYGCSYDTIALHYLPAGANTWQWLVDSSFVSDATAPAIKEKVLGPRYVQHVVSNGICSDTATEIVNLDNILKAGFQSPAEICPKDPVTFNNISIGNIKSWNWNFGDGSSSSLESPAAHIFPDSRKEQTYNISLVVQNTMGCYDTAIGSILKMQSCSINVPNGFTPNGDGINDYLYPLNAFNTSNLEFRVFNRAGQLVFETRDWSHKWDGTVNGKPQPSGAYVWTLSYTKGSPGKKFFLSGSSVLIR